MFLSGFMATQKQHNYHLIDTVFLCIGVLQGSTLSPLAFEPCTLNSVLSTNTHTINNDTHDDINYEHDITQQCGSLVTLHTDVIAIFHLLLVRGITT